MRPHRLNANALDEAVQPFGIGFYRLVSLIALGIGCGICHLTAVNVYRHIKLFKNGRNQAVRIPREFELPGDDAVIWRDGDKLIIEAAPPRSLLAILAELTPIDDTFPEVGDPPPAPISL